MPTERNHITEAPSASDSQSHQLDIDLQNDSITTALVTAVSRVSNCDPTDLPPLFDVLDPDALEALVSADHSGMCSNVVATFVYAGYEIEISSSGRLEFRPVPSSLE